MKREAMSLQRSYVSDGPLTGSHPPISGSDMAELFPAGSLTPQIEIIPHQSPKGPGLAFFITLKDGSGQPIFATKSQVAAWFQGNQVTVTPAPPASDRAVEEENQKAIKEKRYGDLRFDHWVYSTQKINTGAPVAFGIIVTVGDSTWRNLFSADPAASRSLKSQQSASRDIGSGDYNGPSADTFTSWVVHFGLSSQVFNPGDKITANITLYDTIWSHDALVSCSYADPNSITVDGVPTPSEYGHAAFYPRWQLGAPYLSIQPPYYRVPVYGVGSHVVTFKLDPQYSGKYFNYDGSTYDGPYVTVGSPAVSGWDWDIGFVITSGATTTDAPGLNPTEPQVDPDTACSVPGSTISAKSGNNLVTDTDLSHNSLGPSFAFSRAYSSLWSYQGPLGYGWTHRYNTSLKVQSDGSIQETDEVGTPYRYTIQSAGAYTAPAGRNAILVKNSDGTFSLTEKDYTVKKFSAAGVLLSLTDVNNNTMALTYDPSGKLSKITDAAGRDAVITSNADGTIASVKDPAGRTVSYVYSSGDLVQVTDVAGLNTAYAYTDHKLTKITLFNGKTYLFGYDSQGRLISRSDALSDNTAVAYDPTTKTSVVTDRRGNKTTYTMDDQGRQISRIDPNGAETRYTWDDNNNITKIVDPRGGIQELTFDSRGNMLTRKDQLGAVTTYTYSDKNQVTSVKDAYGKVQQMVYDSKGNLLKTINARGVTMASFSYDSKGNRISATDALGHTSHVEFDDYGNPVKTKDPIGNVTRSAYDIVDRMTGTTNAKGKLTSFAYGVKDQLLTTTYPDGTSSTNDWYPCCALLKSVTDANQNVINYGYDGERRLIKVLDPLSGATLFEYDENGNRTGITDPKGNKTVLTYDKTNRLTKISYPDGTSEAFTYYPDGLLQSKTDGNGATITLQYDAAGRMTEKDYPDGSKVQYSYDSVGTLLSMSDATGTYTYGHDDLYRLTKVTLPSGKAISYSYNDQGLRTGMTDYDKKSYAYVYDKNNRLQTLTLPGKEKVEYQYDPLSALSKVSYPNNIYSAYNYNDMERLTSISTMKKGFRDRLISEFGYSYDKVGNRLSMEDRRVCGMPRKTQYSYDQLYRLASVSYPDKSEEGYQYDLASNRTLRETKKMKFTSCFDGWRWEEKGCRAFVRCLFHPEYITYRVNYQYDVANKLLALKETRVAKDKEHGVRSVAYSFDDNGNEVKESVLPEGAKKAVDNTFGYDFENRLTSAVMKGIKQYGFTYNANGNRIRTTVGEIERQGHHGMSRCGHDTDRLQELQHLYDGSSLVMDLDAKGKVAASYSYGLGLTGITSPALKGYYHSDALGSITEITGREGMPLRAYRYSAWGDIMSGEAAHDVNPFRYVGSYGVRWQDNTLGMYHMGARWYQPGVGRFVSRDPVWGKPKNPQSNNRYVYVSNSPMTFIDPSGFLGISGPMYWSPPDYCKHDFCNCFGKCLEDNDPLNLIEKGLLTGVGGPIPKSLVQFFGGRVIKLPGSSQYTTLPSIISLLKRGGGRSWMRISEKVNYF